MRFNAGGLVTLIFGPLHLAESTLMLLKTLHSMWSLAFWQVYFTTYLILVVLCSYVTSIYMSCFDSHSHLISVCDRDIRKIFPFEFFHLGGDEVNTDCWKNTTHVKEWYNHMTLSFHVTHRIYFLSNQNHPRRYILSQKNQYVLKSKERLISSQMGSMWPVVDVLSNNIHKSQPPKNAIHNILCTTMCILDFFFFGV